MRLAWFTPLPPDRSGIAAYSAELLPRLGASHEIDVFLADPAPRAGTPPHALDRTVRCRSAHEFPVAIHHAPYDLVVYQLGNSRCHDYMWAYLTRYPGLVVLHDARLHHARAQALLTRGRRADYRAEFAWNHPDVPAGVTELAVSGLDTSCHYLWPMLRTAVAPARALAVHSAVVAEELGAAFPHTAVHAITMGVSAHDPPPRRVGAALRRPLFAAFGLVTPEKRIPQILRAFAAILPHHPSAGLRLVGDLAPHYDVRSEIDALGLTSRVDVTGYMDDRALAAHLDEADVCLCLRWPTARESSASWLRCLAAGKATIVTDLVHGTDVPSLDPRSWSVLHAATDAGFGEGQPSRREPVAVSIDILDEDHSLRLAMARLATDASLRAQLSRAATARWREAHTLEHMVADYERLLPRAAATPVPTLGGVPPHLVADGAALARALCEPFGVCPDVLAEDSPARPDPGAGGARVVP